MREFRTIIDIPKSESKIHHNQGIMLMGSCFSGSIGQKLAGYKFPVNINPFGVLYNPASISKSLQILMGNKAFTDGDLHFANERWFSFYHHSDFSHQDKNQCLQLINTQISASNNFLRNARYLIITLGTAYVFKRKQNGQVVSNCHKLPASEFIRNKLSVEEIASELQAMLAILNQFNPTIEVIFTLSPIRHWKDGAHGNQLSKAALLLAVEHIIEMNSNCSYFPSYEIMMDELRDYRFYDADMLHISDVAVDYIFELFAGCYFSEETKKLNQEIDKIVKASKHKVFNPMSESYISFLDRNITEINDLLKKHFYLDFYPEILYFESEKEKYI
jgi:hypothetical protein